MSTPSEATTLTIEIELRILPINPEMIKAFEEPDPVPISLPKLGLQSQDVVLIARLKLPTAAGDKRLYSNLLINRNSGIGNRLADRRRQFSPIQNWS